MIEPECKHPAVLRLSPTRMRTAAVNNPRVAHSEAERKRKRRLFFRPLVVCVAASARPMRPAHCLGRAQLRSGSARKAE